MRVNFCFDFVIAVREHDASVRKYAALFGIEPIELAPASLPEKTQRCTIFPLWNQGDRGMVFSVISSSDPASPINEGIRRRGEGLALFGIDVDDVDAMLAQGRAAGVAFETREPVAYDYGRMLNVRPESTHGVPIFFSTHSPGWWQKSLNGGRDPGPT
jgi:hypothetical protein